MTNEANSTFGVFADILLGSPAFVQKLSLYHVLYLSDGWFILFIISIG